MLGGGVDDGGAPQDQRVGADPVEVEVVDDRDVAGPQPAGEVLGAAVQAGGAAHAGGVVLGAGASQGADAHGADAARPAWTRRPPTRVGDRPVTHGARHRRAATRPGSRPARVRRTDRVPLTSVAVRQVGRAGQRRRQPSTDPRTSRRTPSGCPSPCLRSRGRRGWASGRCRPPPAPAPHPAPAAAPAGRRRRTGPGKRELKRLETRARIVDAAAELFAERGFDSVSVVEIAARAGVVEKTVFNHVPVKEGLVFEADPPVREALLEAVRGGRPGSR